MDADVRSAASTSHLGGLPSELLDELMAGAIRIKIPPGSVTRGRDIVEWLVECGFVDQRPEDLPDPSVVSAPQPLLAPGGHSMSLQKLARAGATLAGRLVAVHGEHLHFDSSAPSRVAAGDAFAARIRAMLVK